MRNQCVVFRSVFAVSAVMMVTGAAHSGPRSRSVNITVLSLAESRAYMLELINRDRASLGLKPVELDEIATNMGQSHAQEMASHGYMAHWDLKGRPPDQRYTESRGVHYVQENVYFLQDGGEIKEQIQTENAPRFTKEELENIEAAYFNQRPPNDSHRRNIAAAAHTHVGIGLARAGFEFGPSAIANCQEFVNSYIVPDSLPTESMVGDLIHVSGQVAKGCALDSISMGHEAAPHPMTISELKETRKYGTPKYEEIYREGVGTDGREIRIRPDGRFTLDLHFKPNQPLGLYYLAIKVKTIDGRVVIASQRTILVK